LNALAATLAAGARVSDPPSCHYGAVGRAAKYALAARHHMAGLLTDEQLIRELRVLYANRPLQFSKLILKYYKGERAKQIIETLKTWPA
jgi:hypothetical protein